VCFHKLLFLAFLTFVCGSVALAQGGTTLHGTVIVPSGAPVPQAMVNVTGTGGGQSATTNEHGEYKVTGLGVGVYHVSISAPGFERFEIEISLSAGENHEADAVLMQSPKVIEPVPPAGAAAGQSSETQAAPVASAPAQAPGALVEFTVKAPKGKAALYGYVTDQSNAVIPTGTATATGSVGTVTASPNARGQYVLNGLAPGAYKLTVSAEGFAPFETEVTLAADQSLEIDAQLQPPSAKESVSVEASNASHVETESSHIEGTITEKEVLKTPLNGRNFTQLIALQPGVSNQTGQDEALVGVKGSVKYSVNGGRVEYNNFDVDGSDVLNAGLNGAESTLMVYPSLDAIQEVKVLTSNYGAMYGRSASGTVLVTTKTGGNQMHGSLYDFVRNEFFNARNYFDLTKKAPLYRRQDFGGTIGGPLYIPGLSSGKNHRTYFFWSEEFRLEKSPQEFNQAVPTLGERGIGVANCPGGPGSCADFSDVCPVAVGQAQPTFDRASYPDCPTPAGYTFPGNLVPIDRTSAALLNTGLIPLPNSSIGCNSSLAGTVNATTQLPNVPCYVSVISPATYWREELARIDHDFSPSTRLSFRYIHDSWNTTVATPEWGYVQNSFPTVENKLDGPGTSLVVRLTNTISPSLLNEFVVSYVNAHITLTDENGPGANLQPVLNCAIDTTGAPCLNYIFNNGQGGKPPGIVIAGTNAEYGGNGFAADPSYMPWQHTNPTYGLSDNVSKVWGHHTVQFGVQVVDSQRNETNGAIGAATGDLQGILTFSNQNTGINTGNAFANMLIGPGTPTGGCLSGDGFACAANAIKSFQQDSAQLRYHNDYWIAEPYVQDDWRVNPRLTVNMGLRLSMFGNFHEKNLTAYNWEPTAFSTALASTVSISEGTNGVAAGSLEVGGQPVPLNTSDPTNGLNPVVTNGLVQCGMGGTPASCMQSHIFEPAPRIGFAWDPKGDGKTSLRGGYGVFFEHGTAKEANTGSLEGSAPLVLTMTDPFPSVYSAIGLTGQGGTPVAFPLDVTSIPTKTVWPYVQQWSFSVQRQLVRNTLATIAYVGSKGTHLTAELQMNQLPAPPTGPDTGFLPGGNPFTPGQPLLTAVPGTGGPGDCTYNNGNFVGPGGAGINGVIVTPSQPAWVNLVAACYGAAGSPNPNSLRQYLGFERILSLQNIADSQYHALQATIRHTHGPLTLGGSYTWSHSLDDSSDRSDASFVNSANIKSSWASSNFDERHLLNFNYVYDLPNLSRTVERWWSFSDAEGSDDHEAPKSKSNSNALHQLLDGWQVSGITVFQSGTPFSVINGGSNLGISVLDNAGVANGAGTGSYPDVVGDPRAALSNGATRFNAQSIGPLLYNPAAFVAPQGLTFGDAGRNFLNNPHRLNFDLTGLKNFKITEGSNLEFRVEAFNVFNHTEFRIFNPNLGNGANNTISCYAGALSNYSAVGGYTISGSGQPIPVDCTTGSSFLHPIDAHRPRTIQLGLKYSF
jgi:hypothetical protein